MSMKTIIQSIILASLLSGCYQRVNQIDIANATQICHSKGGIYSITARFDGDEIVSCKDGTSYFMK